MLVRLEDRHSDLELFSMFNVDVSPNIPLSEGERNPPIEEPYCLNDIRVRLWKITKRPLSRGERKALQTGDHICEGVTTEPPGSSRVADLAKFYETAQLFDEPPSPFNV